MVDGSEKLDNVEHRSFRLVKMEQRKLISIHQFNSYAENRNQRQSTNNRIYESQMGANANNVFLVAHIWQSIRHS